MIYTDQPITNEKDDILDRHRFIDHVTRTILEWDNHASLVIGIYGSWGDGKSSILNLIKEQLKEKVAITFFDPWFFNSQEELIRTYFTEITRVITKKLPFFSRIKFRIGIRKFTKKLSSIPITYSKMGFSLNLRDLASEEPSPNILKEELFKDLINRRKHDKRKIVIFLDNLDRLLPEEILLVLKLIRLCGDFEDIVYVLAFDDIYVIKALDHLFQNREKEISGEEYLKKIIQIDITLPAIDLGSVDSFIESSFEKLKKKYKFDWEGDFNNRFSAFYIEQIRGKLIRNFRDAKRFLNGVTFSLPLVLGEVNYADWLVLEAMRVFCPLSYSLVRENINLLSPKNIELRLPWTSYDQKQYKDNIEQLISHIDEKYRDFSLAAFEYLFSGYKTWRQNPINPPILSDTALEESSRHQRIDSPEYRDEYFQFGPKISQLPDTRVAQFIADLNTKKSGDLKAFIREQIMRIKSEGHLIQFFDRLILRVGMITREVDSDFIEILASLANIYSQERIIFMDSEKDRAQVLMYSLIAQNSNENNMRSLLELAVEKASTDAFAVSMVYYINPVRNRILRRVSEFDDVEIKNKLLERLVRQYVDGAADIFALNKVDYSLIIYHWAGELLKDSQRVMKYLDKEFHKEPAYIGKFLEIFMTLNPLSDNDNNVVFNINEFHKLFDESWLLNIIAELKPSNSTTQREKKLLESFISQSANNKET
jgi:hypothetical protein